MTEIGEKHDGGKPNPLLLERDLVHALALVNEVLDHGAKKYAPRNWQHVPNALERYDAAARRHRRARDMGETHDPESGLPHIAHEITSLLFILEICTTGNSV